MNRYWILAATALFSCTTFEDIDSGLTRLHGQPADSLIAIIGLPVAEQKIAGRNILIWNTDKNFTISTPVTTYSSGTANAYGTYGSAYGNYTSSTTTYVPQQVNYTCTIKVTVDQKYIITGHDFEGNIGGCERYSQKIVAVLGTAATANN